MKERLDLALVDDPELDKHYGTPHVAEMFSVTTETVRRWISEGRLEAKLINGHWRVPRRSLVKFAQSRYGSS